MAIEIKNFARMPTPGTYRFGVAPNKEFANELRRLADRIEAGELAIQSVQGSQLVQHDEYYIQALYIEFAEKEKPETQQGRVVPKRIICLDA